MFHCICIQIRNLHALWVDTSTMIHIIWREEGRTGWTDTVTTTTRRQKPIRGGGGARWRQEEKFVAWQPVSAGFRVGGERERRGARPADTGIDYEERPHPSPLPPFATALRGWPATAATHRRIAREILRSRRPWIFASLSRLQRSIPSLS